jgi:hypothetical protein
MDAYELGIVVGTLGLGIGMLVFAAYRLLSWLFPA